MSDISTNFSRKEFECKCGCGFDTVDNELLTLSELVRDLNGRKPLTPSSGCRCEKHNHYEGGSEASQHLLGRAADFPVENPGEVYSSLCKLFPDNFGFGLYDTFIHVDSRTGKARWRG